MIPPRRWVSALCFFTMAVVGLGTIARAQAPPAATPPVPKPSAEDAAVRALIDQFAQRYNARDADGVAALFTADARVYDADGHVTEGRAAIRARYAGAFEANPTVRLKLAPGTIRFLTPDVAIEDGTAVATVGDSAEAHRDAYTATHVRKEGTWLTAEIRDRAAPAETADVRDDGDRALADLAWLVGDWMDEDDDGIVATTCRWSDDHKYLLRDFHVKLAGAPARKGTQRIGWDPVRGQVRSWAFDSEGGFTESFWTQVAPDRWILRADGFLRDGRPVSATTTVHRLSPDTFRWTVSDRVVGDTARSEPEDVLIVRKPPAPTPRRAK